jgi:hypothetical protein
MHAVRRAFLRRDLARQVFCYLLTIPAISFKSSA